MNDEAKTTRKTCDIKIGVVGGDARQLTVARELAARGFETAVYAFDTYGVSEVGDAVRSISLEGAVRGSSAVILPIPYTNDGVRLNCPHYTPPESDPSELRLDRLFDRFYAGQIVLAGRIDDAALELADKAGVRLFDYFAREELLVANASPTAEGAVAIAMNELPITIRASRAVVLGYGRVGRVLAATLRALGAEVTVAARKHSDLAWAELAGCRPLWIRELWRAAAVSDVIFNTVPDLILTKPILSELAPGTLIIDLASKPGGVDMKAARELGLNVVWALSLPGKVAPVTAGRIIADSILNILAAEGVVEAP